VSDSRTTRAKEHPWTVDKSKDAGQMSCSLQASDAGVGLARNEHVRLGNVDASTWCGTMALLD
jgi:hypothetical protein